MEIRQKRRQKVPFEDLYPTRLQLYIHPPTQEMSLEEFNEVAMTRQRGLQEISNIKEKQIHGDLDKQTYLHKMKEITKQYFPLIQPTQGSTLGPKEIDERRKDHISHYILRLAYCESEDLRRWFLSQEVDLLRYRLQNAKMTEIDEIIKRYREYLPLEKVTCVVPQTEHFDDNAEMFFSDECSFYYAHGNFECYKVYFTEVLDLVQKRQVIIKNGYVYLPCNNNEMIISLICNKFRSMLSQDLVRTVAYMGMVKEDERVGRTIKNLRTKYLGEDFTNAGTSLTGQFSIRDLDKISKESYSPCMRHLHESLREEHHLRHFGRLQYGLFLKSIGITLDQALQFWREEFIKKMEPDKFDKQYAYNIRHSYGKEGKRTNYTPYSCMKIIMSNTPGTGDHHGCPFRHWDEGHIQQMLVSYGIPMKSIQQIMDYVQSSHYQLACQKYFEVTHGLTQSSFSLEHPTQYFIESRNVRGAERGGDMGGASSKKEEEKEVEDNDEMVMEFNDLSEQELAQLMDIN